MDSVVNAAAIGSSYTALPSIPDALVDRSFRISDGNIEITSMDIAPHGAFVVIGTSSGMVLLFDMSNPYCQKDGLLIGQIRARGMHTNLILTVKFSEDGRFVFAGVSKGSSEMLAIDLGKVLVEWHSSHRNESFSESNRTASETLQQLQLQSMVTFSFSDAKLRGFGAVVRMDLPHSSEGRSHQSSSNFANSSALYRLACGRGIKNVHIWHFTVGYLVSDVSSELQGGSSSQRMMHGKWEYVCDVASNGNTITHIEFRQSGHELLSKSAGMGIRLWDLRGGDTSNNGNNNNNNGHNATAEKAEGTETEVVPSSTAAARSASPPTVSAVPLPGAAGAAAGPTWLIKPSYTDISNSQDVKCLLPVGSGAYGGTYQFAVLNTSAPKEANRDVLELPERFSGDAAAGSSAAASSNSLLRGRRITREIEQVICTDEGAHALLLCADGGVVYYHAPVDYPSGAATTFAAAAGADTSGDNGEGVEVADAGDSSSNSMRGTGSTGSLLELPCLFRQKDLQQHTGSWALRRVGRQGLVVLLRAYPDPAGSSAASSAVVVEARLLAQHLPAEASQRLLDECTAVERVRTGAHPNQQQQSLYYYQDSTAHSAQELARKAWKTTPSAATAAVAAKRSISSGVNSSNSSQKAAKKVKLLSISSAEASGGATGGEKELMDTTTANAAHVARKKSSGGIGASGEKSPRPSSAHPSSADKRSLLVTPAAAPLNANKLNKVSPYDAADRLVSCEADLGNGYANGRGGESSPLTGAPPVLPLPLPRSSRLSSRQQQHLQQQHNASSSSSSSFAKLRALRDDDSSAGEEEEPVAQIYSYKELEVGPAPKVRRMSIPSLPASWAACTPTTATNSVPVGVSSSLLLETSPNKGGNEVFVASIMSLIAKWSTGGGGSGDSLQSGLSSRREGEDGVLLGLAGRPQQKALGSTALQRLGVIMMEQDRLQAQFVREVSAQLKPLTVTDTPAAPLKSLLAVVSLYRRASEELVQRQQLELQGACAVDSICSASCGGSSTSNCWGEGLKVVFRHESTFSQAQMLHRSLTELLALPR